MKKAVRKLISITCGFALAFSLFLPLAGAALAAPVSASADEVVTAAAESDYIRPALSDENFAFEDGAMVNKGDGEDSLTRLGFKLNLKNPELLSFYDNANDTAVLCFTLYRDNDGEVVPKWRVLCCLGGNTVIWGHQLADYDQDIRYSDYLDFTVDQNGNERVIDYRTESDPPKITVDGETFVIDTMQEVEKNAQNPLIYYMDDNIWKLGFTTLLDSVNTGYFLELEYGFKNYVTTKKVTHYVETVLGRIPTGYENKKIYDEWKGTIATPTRSIYDVLYNMNKAGMLEAELTDASDLAKAQEILAGEKEEIKVEYLERIGETPFATKKTATVSVPLVGGVPTQGDVEEALGKSLRVLDSATSASGAFIYDETRGIWTTNYAKSVWLETRTVDGKSHHQYLDINKSFADSFRYLGEEVSYDLYDYFWDQTVDQYPVLAGYSPETVYGYFGQAWIPKLNGVSANALFAELFNTETEIYNLLDYECRTLTITSAQYQGLLQSYGYTWLDSFWKTKLKSSVLSFDTTKADYYVFYAAVKPRAAISDSGSTSIGDTDGAFANELEKTVKELKETLEKTQQEAADRTNKFLDLLMSATSVAIIGLLGFGAVYLYRKLPEKRKK